MNLPEMPRWAAGNISVNLADRAADATVFVVDNLIPRALTVVDTTRERIAGLAEGAKNRTTTIAKAALNGAVERSTQEQFNFVMDWVIAPPFGLLLTVVEKVRPQTSRTNEWRIK